MTYITLLYGYKLKVGSAPYSIVYRPDMRYKHTYIAGGDQQCARTYMFVQRTKRCAQLSWLMLEWHGVLDSLTEVVFFGRKRKAR